MKNRNGKKIRDNPSSKDLRKEAKSAQAAASFVSFFEKIGIKNEKLSDAMKEIPELVEKVDVLTNIPDYFNEHFSKRGWVAYESLNVEVMKRAVELADVGEYSKAEEFLVNHYDEDTLKWNLKRMLAVPEFRPRFDLASKALDDYFAGRYYACIPLVLLIMDGFVNDIESKGLFAEGVDLTAWDSIAAHSSGLEELVKIFGKVRKKTSTKTITVPYRNGILHGRDLGYANKIVATKSWAALFTVRDWALAIKNGGKNPKPKPPEPNLLDTLKSYLKIEEKKKKVKEWKARKVEIGKSCPSSGLPEDYEDGSPERTFAHFMLYWSKDNYGNMGQLIKKFSDISEKKFAGRMRENFHWKKLSNFKLLHIRDEASAISELDVQVEFLRDKETIKKDITVRLIYEDEKGNPVVRGEPEGKWKILEHFFYALY